MRGNMVTNGNVQAYYATLVALEFSKPGRRVCMHPHLAPYGTPRIWKRVEEFSRGGLRPPCNSLAAKVAKREHVEALRKLQKRRY